MAEDTSIDSKTALMIKEIVNQNRFTRATIIICTVATIGVFFYGLTEIYTNYQSLTLGYFMQNLELIHGEWNGLDHLHQKQAVAPACAATPGKK